jgi:hypothetical protein
MYRQLRTLRKTCLGLLALAVLGAAPVTAAAGSIGFRNDLNLPIVVQGESIVNGVLQRGQALLIAPRKCAYDTNVKPGNRQITVYDAQNTNRILLRVVIPYDGSDVIFRVVLVPPVAPRMPPRVQIILLPPQPPPGPMPPPRKQ